MEIPRKEKFTTCYPDIGRTCFQISLVRQAVLFPDAIFFFWLRHHIAFLEDALNTFLYTFVLARRQHLRSCLADVLFCR